ncbi:MAG: hypothetical protein ACRDKT_17780, partial [Actinomycetota bacterium]
RSIVAIEWGEAISPLLPRRHLEVEIRRSDDVDAEEERRIVFRPRGQEWIRKIQAMRDTAETLLDAASPETTEEQRFVVTEDPYAREHVHRDMPREQEG